MTKQFIETLKANKKLYIKGLGTYQIKPARKGQVKGSFGRKDAVYDTKYKLRVTFTPDRDFKKAINE